MKKQRISASLPMVFFLLWMLLCDSEHVGLVTLLAALGHECGHLLAAKCMHIPLSGFRLDLLGARLEVANGMLSYGEEWLLAAAGPGVSFLLSLLAAPLWQIWEPARIFSVLSFLLGMLNLLPIRTFDGGRMLESLLLSKCSSRTVTKLTWGISFISLFLLWAIAVYFLLRVGDGLSLFCFSFSLFFRFLEQEKTG